MKILLAVDGSRHSGWAVETVLKIPFRADPEVSVVHVLDTSRYAVPMSFDPSIRERFAEKVQKKMEDDFEEARRLVGEVKKHLEARFGAVESSIERGNPADRLIALAQDGGMDLIVVGSRGLTGIKTFLLGGVSQRIATYSPCSVLIVKRRPSHIKNVLLATDGSGSAEAALAFFSRGFSPDGLEVTVLHVSEYVYDMPKDASAAHGGSETLSKAGFAAKPLSVKGNPAGAIIQRGSGGRADLVVVGAKGATGLKRFFLGSVSRKVMTYLDSSVLIVKNTGR